jgi:Tol biopolymer transport system component
MVRNIGRLMSLITIAMLFHGCRTASSELSDISRTGAVPELYGAGVFSTGAWDFFMAWTPDQRDVFFCHASDDFSTFEIFETRLGVDGRWSQPVHPPFASRWSNSDPHLTIDGRRVFFISNRPLPGETSNEARKSYDVWYADRNADGSWSEGHHLDAALNDPNGNEWSPSVAANGNLYYGSNRAGGRGDQDIWISRFVNGRYQAPENLGDSANTPGGEIEPWIAPDESYLIISGARRPDSTGSYDLYISARRNGVWQKSRPIGAGINTRAAEFNPSVTPDGKWLFFSSNRPHSPPFGPRFDNPRDERNVDGIGNGKTGDIYRIPMRTVTKGSH